MPKIPEYQTRSQIAGASAAPGRKADPGGVSLGSGLQAIGKGLGDVGEAVLQKNTRDEITGFQLEKIQKDQDLDSRYQARRQTLSANINPNSDEYKNFQADTQKDVEDTYGQMAENISTPRAKDLYNANYGNAQEHFFKNVAADKAEMAHAAAINAFQGNLNSQSASLFSDPSAYDRAKSDHTNYVSALFDTGAIDQKTALELKRKGDQELTQATIKGWIQTNPEYAQEQLDKGRWDADIGGDGRALYQGMLDQEYKTRDREEKQRVAEQKLAIKDSNEQLATKFADMHADGKLTVADIKNSPLAAKDREHFYTQIDNDLRRQAKGISKFSSDPVVRSAMLDRLYLPDGDPNKITTVSQLMALNAKGRVGSADMKWLVGRLDKQQSAEGREEAAVISRVNAYAKDVINAGGKDPKSAANVYTFIADFQKSLETGKGNGKSLSELSSPEAVQKMLTPYVRTPVQKLQDRVKQESSYKAQVIKKQGGAAPADRMKNMTEFLKSKGLK